MSLGVYVAACAALGPWYLRVAPVPLAVFAIYPYLKRWTPLCHFGVGVALALAPLAGYAAAHPDLAHVRGGVVAGGVRAVLGARASTSSTPRSMRSSIAGTACTRWSRGSARSRALFSLRAAAPRRRRCCLIPVALELLRLAPGGPMAHLPATLAALALLTATAVLLGLEQRWAENVNLAFFKVNVWVGFVVLAMVLAARSAGGF